MNDFAPSRDKIISDRPGGRSLRKEQMRKGTPGGVPISDYGGYLPQNRIERCPGGEKIISQVRHELSAATGRLAAAAVVVVVAAVATAIAIAAAAAVAQQQNQDDDPPQIVTAEAVADTVIVTHKPYLRIIS